MSEKAQVHSLLHGIAEVLEDLCILDSGRCNSTISLYNKDSCIILAYELLQPTCSKCLLRKKTNFCLFTLLFRNSSFFS